MLITLADAKRYLKITSVTHDTLISDLVSKACAYVETICNRTFDADTYDELYTGANDSVLMLDHSPVNHIDFISDDLDHSTKKYGAVIDTNDILVNCKSGMIEWMSGIFIRSQRNYYVRYNAGYVNVPEDIKMVACDLVAKKFQDIDQGRIGIASKTIKSDNVSFSFLDISKENMNILRLHTKPSHSDGIPVTGWTGAS